jgi:RHS repeat-associated protein
MYMTDIAIAAAVRHGSRHTSRRQSTPTPIWKSGRWISDSYSRFSCSRPRSKCVHHTCSLDRTINRYYDPVTGQFISVDPMVGTTGTPYAYASDNAANRVDFNGKMTLAVCGQAGLSAGIILGINFGYSSQICLIRTYGTQADEWGISETFSRTTLARIIHESV